MDWRVFASAFGLIFLAEMGDKTQLAAITLVAKSGKPWLVFAGASLALVLVSLIGVLVGGLLTEYVPAEYLQRIAAAGFIVIGVLMLVGRL